MRIRILGKTWTLRFAPVAELGRDYGHCDSPDRPRKEIAIREDLKGREAVDTAIHECLHAAGWHLCDEEWIDRLATGISKVLWSPEMLKRILDDDAVRAALAPKPVVIDTTSFDDGVE